MEFKAEEVSYPEKMEALTSTLLGTDIGSVRVRGAAAQYRGDEFLPARGLVRGPLVFYLSWLYGVWRRA